MGRPDRLAEAEKQLRIFVEKNGDEPFSDEIREISDRLSEIRNKSTKEEHQHGVDQQRGLSSPP